MGNVNAGNSYAEPKKPDTKEYLLYDSMYVTFWTRHNESAGTGNRSELGRTGN